MRDAIDVNVLCNAVTDAVDDTFEHPLLAVLIDAANGDFPPVDGAAEFMSPDAMRTRAVVSCTGHAFLLTEFGAPAFDDLVIDGYGGATQPDVLLRIARGAEIGMLDVVMVRRGTGGAGPLGPRHDLEHHPRVQRSRRHRRHVAVLGDERGFVTIGQGLVGRTELSVELLAPAHGHGAGRGLVIDGLRAIPPDQLVFAQVSPGNAASLRMFLACDFVPIGSEILIEPSPSSGGNR